MISGTDQIPKNNYKRKYVTHTSITHNWYPKPPDIQFEERELGIKVAYTADALYEWNIDGLSKYEILNGLSEYEILNVLHEIMILANVYKDANRSYDQVANQFVEDALIFVILKYFLENLSVYRKNIYDNLEHLKTYTLTNFRWYKDVFLSRILIRMNNRALYWKEKFIRGLSNYFTHKVRKKLNNNDNNNYGEFINTIKHIKLNLRNDLRLTN
jgi:hypothetical protein